MTHRKIDYRHLGSDVDLEAEDVRLPDGSRLTPDVADELAERALARRRGRPSVSDTQHTPSFTVRVSPEVRSALESIAASQGRRLSDVSREALTEYVDRHAS